MNSRALRVLEFNKIKEKLKNYTRAKGAKDLIDKLEPYNNVFEVKEHLKETDEALRLLMKKGAPPFEGFHDVRSDVERMEKGGVLGAGQLLKVAQMLRCARRFESYGKSGEDEEKFEIIEDICISLHPLKNVEDAIFNAIAGEDEISDKASSALYNIRRSLKDKNSSVRDKVNDLIRSNEKYLQDNLYTIRGDRYVIPVKAEHKGSVPGLIHDKSSTGATLFIEPMGLVNLNNEIKELMIKERQEIERILEELTGMVHINRDRVKVNNNVLIELDFIFAKAKYASEIDAIMPKISEDGSFDLIEARHPLIKPEDVISNDIYINKDIAGLIITGPNTGGKTVTLKTSGLIHIMALSGLLVPVHKNSTVSFYKEILVDLGDEQSIEQSLSTFSSHMKNIVHIMKDADESSLALFDELGAGTDPVEGAALAEAIIETLRERRTKIIATTHYSELKAYALNTNGIENASVEFDVETLRPTYRLLIGIPGKSNAFEISKRLGLQLDVIDRAKNLINSESLKFEDLIQDLQQKTIDAEENARKTEMLKKQAEDLKADYAKKLEAVEKVRDKAYSEARREAKQILTSAKDEADEILKKMRELEKHGASNEIRRKLEAERGNLKGKIADKESQLANEKKDDGEALTKVKVGMEAFLPSINSKVVILSEPDSRGNVLVEAGIMKVNVKLKDLRMAKGETKQEKKIKKREMKLNVRKVDSSVDLRGLDSQEACYNADKYLDEAYIGGLGEVTLIHGKGTGVLRKAINDMLKRHPHVSSYRLGEYGEGGDGVTVVRLK